MTVARAVASVKEARGHQFSAGGPKQVKRRRREGRGAPGADGVGCLHFRVEMAHFVGILAVNFKFYCMNKTVKIHQNPTDTSEYDATKKANSIR